MINKKILVPLLIFFLLFSVIALGVPNFVDVGTTTEFKGDAGVPADSAWYIGEYRLDLRVITEWTFTHMEDQLFFGEFAKIEYVRYSNFEATSAPTVNDDIDLGYVVGSLWYNITADKGYACLDSTNGAAVWVETTSLGHTNLTSFVDQTPWRVFYSNTDGDVIELALGTAGKYLKSTGATSAPEFDTPAGTIVFTGLTDTPANYTGEGGKYVKVNVGEDALEFGTVAGEANTASNIGSEIEIFKQKTGVDLEFRTLKAESNKITVSNTSDTPDIDIGNSAINRVSYAGSGSTRVDKANVANLSGTIRSVEIWAEESLTGCEVATFYVVSGDNLSTRDYEVIGAVTAGSKQIFSVNIDVQSGDYIGIYYDGGELEADSSGSGRWWTTGVDNIPCTNVTFVPDASIAYSLYGTGFSSTLDYIKFDIVEAEMDVVNLLSTTTVAFNADADTTLYTVPTGKRCVLSYAIVVAAGDAGGTTTVSIGQNTAETDFVPANTLSNLDAEYDSVILMPIPNTTPLKIKSYAADTVIEAQVASQSGTAGNTIYLFGILY